MPRTTMVECHSVFGVVLWLALAAAVARCADATKEGTPAQVSPADAGKQTLEIPALPYVTLMVARDPSVHSELKLSPEQIERVRIAVTEVDQPFWLLRDVPLPKSLEQLNGLHAKLRKQLQSILTAQQHSRLDEIILQARGYKAFLSADVPERLKLPEQTTQQLRELISQAKSEETGAWKKITELLSPQQQASLSGMIGKPFDFSGALRIGCVAPELQGVTEWINSAPLKLADLRGKVVVVHFWTFGCINCIHNLPHYQSWHQKFPDSQVAIIGIHTPETESERKIENVRTSVPKREIKYPVAVDMDAANWKAWANNVWPAVYLIDKQGRVRSWWYGELNWEGAHGEENIRKKIEELLAESN